MAHSEAYIEKRVCDFARKLGWLVYKFVSPNNRAVPDRMFMRGNRAFFIEFKRSGAAPTKLQLREHEKIRSAGFEVRVIDSVESGLTLFREIA